jgi:hypothetical protein
MGRGGSDFYVIVVVVSLRLGGSRRSLVRELGSCAAGCDKRRRRPLRDADHPVAEVRDRASDDGRTVTYQPLCFTLLGCPR